MATPFALRRSSPRSLLMAQRQQAAISHADVN
jgi:hypothetical protein